MALEARAADLMGQQQVEMMEATAVRNRVQMSESWVEWPTMLAHEDVQRAELPGSRRMRGRIRSMRCGRPG